MTGSLLALLALAGATALGLLTLDEAAGHRSGRARAPATTQRRKWRDVDVAVGWVALPAAALPRRVAEHAPRALRALSPADIRGIAVDLRHAIAEWSHVGGTSYHPMSPAMAEGLVDVISRQAERALASIDEPSAMVAGYRAGASAESTVVALIVAARGEIRDFDPSSAAQAALTLRALSNVSNTALIEGHLLWVELGPGAALRLRHLRAVR